MNATGKFNRKRSGLNRHGLKRVSRKKRVDKKYNDWVNKKGKLLAA